MTIELNNVSSGYSTGVINNNFQLLEDYINEKVLNRDGTEVGEANQMELPLDMNSNPILNAITDPDNPRSLVTREFADSRYVNLTGDTMQGSLNMASYPVFVRIAINGNEPARKDELDAERSQRISTDNSIIFNYQAADAALARSIADIPAIREGDLTKVGDAQVTTSTGAQTLVDALDSRMQQVRTVSGNIVAEDTTITSGEYRSNLSVVFIPDGVEVTVEEDAVWRIL